MTHPLFQGLLMGATIFGLDVFLRPRAGEKGGIMEIMLFFAEGAACDIVYGMVKGGCANAGDHDLGDLFKTISIRKSIMAGLTIWLTDFFLRPENFKGELNAIIKFGIQGMMVMFVLGYEM